MEFDAQLLKDNTDIVDVIGGYTNLKKKGREYIGICPFHDEKTPSFSVDPKKQVYKCFGCNAGGDVFKFIMDIENLTFQQAIHKLGGVPGALKPPRPTMHLQNDDSKKPNWETVTPIPENTPPLPQKYKKCKIVKYYPYYNINGELITYTFRVTYPDGSKNIIPLSYCVCGDKTEWRFKRLPNPQPIYGVEQLLKKPEAKILMVEGEKDVDNGRELFKHEKKIIVLSWVGGATGVMAVFWKQLENRTIVYWPDADTQRYKNGSKKGEVMPTIEQPGTLSMIKINKIIGGNSRILKHTKDKVNGWDLSDAIKQGWDIKKIKKYINDKMVSFENLYEVKRGEKTRNVQKPFQALGYNSTHGNVFYYYLPNGTNKVIELSPVAHSKMNLLSLAPITYWEREYSGRRGADYTIACNDCMRDCEERGIYDPFRIRGRGAWFDSGRVVLHMGNRLIVDNVNLDVSGIDSHYIYESGLPVEDKNHNNPLFKEESQKLLDICKLFSWKDDISSRLLAGWLALAPICGAIDWRPHVWVTGEAGTGKSWIQDNVVSPVLGRFSLDIASATTEAGARCAIGSDAVPVRMDEVDVETREAFSVLKKLIELARLASSNKDSRLIKGTSSGGSNSYCIRSMFLFSSINTRLAQQSDESRFSVLKLTKRQDYVDGSMFVKLKTMVSEVITKKYCSMLRARSVKMIPTIRKNIDIFAPIVAKVVKSSRYGDQLGALLAGCFSLVSDDVATKQQVTKFVKKIDWEVETDINFMTDQEKLVYTLCEQLISCDYNKSNKSVGTLLKVASWEPKIGSMDDEDFKQRSIKKNALDELRKYGISITKSKETERQRVVFAEKHSKLSSLLKDTSWYKGYSLVLSRYTGATRARSVFTGGMRYNCVSIPYENIFTEEVEVEEEEEF